MTLAILSVQEAAALQEVAQAARRFRYFSRGDLPLSPYMYGKARDELDAALAVLSEVAESDIRHEKRST